MMPEEMKSREPIRARIRNEARYHVTRRALSLTAMNFELLDELQALSDIPNYEIPNEHDPESEDVDKLLEGKSQRRR
jgi:hypothetical protein